VFARTLSLASLLPVSPLPSSLQGYRPATGTTEVTDAAGKTKTETVFGDFRWMSYHAIAEMMDAIGSAVAHLDLAKPNDLGVRAARAAESQVAPCPWPACGVGCAYCRR
jgi:hypothetical protein